MTKGATLGQQLDAAFETLATKQDFAELKGEFAEVKSDVGALKAEFAEVKSDVGTLKGEFAELKGEFADLRAQFTAQDARVTASLDEMKRLMLRMIDAINANTERNQAVLARIDPTVKLVKLGAD